MSTLQALKCRDIQETTKEKVYQLFSANYTPAIALTKTRKDLRDVPESEADYELKIANRSILPRRDDTLYLDKLFNCMAERIDFMLWIVFKEKWITLMKRIKRHWGKQHLNSQMKMKKVNPHLLLPCPYTYKTLRGTGLLGQHVKCWGRKSLVLFTLYTFCCRGFAIYSSFMQQWIRKNSQSCNGSSERMSSF